VGGDAHDVFHHRQWLLEHTLVDLLMDVTHAHSALIVGGRVGFVDVADLQGLGVQNFTVNLELAGNFLKLFFLVSHKPLVLWEE
jgi:hypothetical protein